MERIRPRQRSSARHASAALAAEVSYDAFPDGPATPSQLRRGLREGDVDGEAVRRDFAHGFVPGLEKAGLVRSRQHS